MHVADVVVVAKEQDPGFGATSLTYLLQALREARLGLFPRKQKQIPQGETTLPQFLHVVPYYKNPTSQISLRPSEVSDAGLLYQSSPSISLSPSIYGDYVQLDYQPDQAF